MAADRRSPDPAYQAHRWWARRPPALLRALLLAATLPADTTQECLWRAYASPEPHLDNMTVVDPFLGGGTTVVEAARLGARARGLDVDPLAVLINQHQLMPPDPADVLAAGRHLVDHVAGALGHLWATPATADDRWTPLHYFAVAAVTCPECHHQGPLYRSLVLARSVGHAGSVVRDVAVTAFCPDCLALHDCEETATEIRCCGTTRRLEDATFRGARYSCPACGHRSSHEALKSGASPRILLAVEETPAAGGDAARRPRRRIRAATSADRELAQGSAAEATAAVVHAGAIPIRTPANDNRPVSFGITTIGDLHTPRQLAYLQTALAWVATAKLDEAVARALRLAVSSTITSNNRLCGYARDYGRLAPLFSIRAFSLPWLTVELNPLNPTGGRGTLAAALSRIARSCADVARRNIIAKGGKTNPVTVTWTRRRHSHSVTCADATTEYDGQSAPDADDRADICITDPPYFDFIPYDALSQVYRAWLPDQQHLSGPPLLPQGAEPVTEFGTRLGRALAHAASACKENALLAFTYKGGDIAWDAVGLALDHAKLCVTALWPVLADPHMGHHAHEGNCEYDIVVVTRQMTASEPSVPPDDVSVAHWTGVLRPALRVSAADEANMRSAIRIAAPRWAAPLS
ncbi:Adenine-specific DNA methylase, contains a Zn-ribbon domain [Micromonospora rhizosphaerae]|uniref:Adenine-specific DNA methylase, contains a Zn-ribbon domain n=1 Tax=Micromonospora rhizosphaerae TaxID=568872 RepID=A0A1C6T3F1_9ACTN|nr:Adenine-specific DNA methylase, contains a Zn-ribbon domain [Micromonospora rhizosphaerae]